MRTQRKNLNKRSDQMNLRNVAHRMSRGQSSLELLITLAFGLIILLPIVVLAFIQISNSSSTLATTEAQAAASKLASVSASIGAQGAPAKQLVLMQIPQQVQNIYVGTLQNTPGHVITIVINTNAGLSYVTAYTPVNVSGYLQGDTSPGVYLVNVSVQNNCPTNAGISCVYIAQT